MVQRRGGFVGWLLLIAALGLAIRLAYIFISRVDQLPLYGDAAFFSIASRNLVRGYGFVQPLTLKQQSASHPPLYLLFVAIPALVWPAHSPTQTVLMVWSAMLGTGSIVVIGYAGREIVGERMGLVAAVLAAIYPGLWVHDGMLLSETSAIFATALVILLAYRFVHRPSWARALWLGIACGLAALARSELLLLVPLVVAPLALMAREVDWRKRLTALVVGGVAAGLVVAPWVIYNETRFKAPVTLSTNFGGTLAAANCQETYFGKLIGYKDYRCSQQVITAASKRHRGWAHFDEAQQDDAYRSESLRYVKAHLFRLPVVVLARLGRITHLYRPFQEVPFDHIYLKQEIWVGYAIVWSFWLVGGLAIGGAVLLRRRRIPVWTLLAILVIVMISVATTFAQTRYRAPAEVSLVIFAAVGVDALVGHWRPLRGADLQDHPDADSSTPDPDPVLEPSPSPS